MTDTLAATLKSTFLDGLIYNPSTMVLTVLFKNGKEYKFADVPMDVYTNFVNAESAGVFFSAEIKGKFKAPEDNN